MMNKGYRYTALLIATFFILTTLVGCANVQRKFIRKKKPRNVQPQVYTDKEYVKPYSHRYYYVLHWQQWKSWHQELLKMLDGNAKRRERSAEEVLGHLKAMRMQLIEPKLSELDLEIERVEKVVKEMSFGRSNTNTNQMRFNLERSLRVISGQFQIEDIEEFIKSDDIEL